MDTSNDLHGRIALVTGANTGIGRVTARELALRGMRVFAACKSEARTQALLEEVQALGASGSVEWIALDLGDFISVRKCANQFLAMGLPLHLLVNNAGLGGSKGLTKSGFELAFGVNHLGHFLLTTLLLDKLKASAPARIVNVASRAHARSKGLDWQALTKPTASATGVAEYSNSKLANVLFSAELARRLEGTGVRSYALHPGVVATDVWRAVPWFLRPVLKLARMKTVEEGAQTTLHCCLSNQAGMESGLYYDECKPKTPSTLAQDISLAKQLWQRSETWIQETV